MSNTVTISGRLFVKLVKASNLPKSDLFSKDDPYVLIRADHHVLGRTKTTENTNDPVWNESLHFDAEFEVGGNVFLEVYDKDRITRDDLLGFVKIPTQSIHHRTEEDPVVTSHLEGKHSKDNTTLTYSISFRKFSWEEEVARFEESNKQLQENISELEASNNALQGVSDQLHSEVAHLQKIGAQLTTDVEHLTTENSKLEEVSKNLHAENEKLAQTNSRLKDNVTKFQEQNTKLKGISDSLREENENFQREVDRLSHTIKGLETVKETMESYADQNKHDLGHIMEKLNATLAEQKEVMVEQKNVLRDTETATKQQEKILLLQLQSQCQYLDHTQGLDKKEFQLWLSLIPKKFLESPTGLEFSRIDRDHDGIISVPEFNALVDQLVQDHS